MLDLSRKPGTADDPIYIRDAGLGAAVGATSGASVINLQASLTLATGLTRSLWANGNTENQTISTSAVGMEIVSSSAADAAAGTGARTVLISGLTAAFVVQSETVTLNGVTAVALVNTYMRINSATIATAGTGLVNAGSLTIRATADTPVYAVISAGEGRLNQICYTVPASKVAVLAHLSFGSGGDSDETAPPLEMTQLNLRVGYTGASAAALTYQVLAKAFSYRGADTPRTLPSGLIVLPEKSILLPQVFNNTAGDAALCASAVLLEYAA